MNILVVDDDDMQRDLLAGFLKKRGYSVETAENGARAIALFQHAPFSVVLLDHRMPDMNGDDVLTKLKEINPLPRTIMITAYGSVETAIDVMKRGAFDFMQKPVDLNVLSEKVEQAAKIAAVDMDAAAAVEATEPDSLPLNIIAESPAMKSVLSVAVRVAETPFAVLIRGETGTGKELIARLIHLLSENRDGPFVVVNCGAVPETLFESELFGHEKGAFTGAAQSRKGRFETADGGTLFLDEVGELPLSLQPKLLRALQEKTIVRVGGEREIPLTVRVLAATNRNLREMAAAGEFREDLYYRLKVFDIEIPPLRRRKEDIPPLVDMFLSRLAPKRSFHPDALFTLMKYPFPGNVRELEHLVQRTATLARGSTLQTADLPEEIRLAPAEKTGTLADRVSALEREMIRTALSETGGNQMQAATRLGISERVLRYKIKKYGIR